MDIILIALFKKINSLFSQLVYVMFMYLVMELIQKIRTYIAMMKTQIIYPKNSQ
jgi:hypothetical protein